MMAYKQDKEGSEKKRGNKKKVLCVIKRKGGCAERNVESYSWKVKYLNP